MNIFFGNVEQTALRSVLRKPGLSLHLPRTCIHGRCNFLIVCVMYYMYIHTYVFMVEYDVRRYAVLFTCWSLFPYMAIHLYMCITPRNIFKALKAHLALPFSAAR